MKYWKVLNIRKLICRENLVRILLATFVAVFSFCVLANKVPEAKWIENTVESLDESKNTIMEFSGATIATSLAISALPDDFASPLANTLTDMNKYFVFIFAVLFVEKLIVVEGIKISFAYMIPIACVLYVLSIMSRKTLYKEFATKIAILAIAVVVVVPFSTHFTETICDDYLVYVDETIAEAEAGAAKVNDVMIETGGNTNIFDKLSKVFETAIKDVTMLLDYFNNVIKKCVNSIAIMMVTTFVLPLLMLAFFKWLLKELFSLNLNVSISKIREFWTKEEPNKETGLICKEDE
ncbi:MAG: hypothetical protein IKW08_04860 [Roseburia sp.]|nr:hypothetical protein [Roseburia sp.]